MASHSALLLLAALALALAAGVSARPAQSPAPPMTLDVAELASAFSGDGDVSGHEMSDEHFEGCAAYCNDELMEHSADKECWGKYFWHCGNKTAGGMAVLCDGHHKSFHVPSESMYVSACEGLAHYFKLKIWTCPKTGAQKKMFFGKGCLGSNSWLMKVDEATVAPVVVSAAMTPSASPRLEDILAAALRSDDHASDGANGNVSGSTEARCKGMGGEVKVFTWGATAAANNAAADDFPADYDAMLSAFEGTAGGGLNLQGDAKPGCSHRTADAPPAADVMGAMVDVAVAQQQQRAGGMVNADGMSCTLTCNGNEPWIGHGVMPCWGVLTVECEAKEEEQEDVMRRSLAEARSAATGSISMPKAAATHPKLSESETWVYKTQCMGLWTGILGHMCWGETLVHSAKDWGTGAYDKWVICSGKLGVKYHHQEGKASMGFWCKGSEVQHMCFE
ncbi:hypothetical protein FOA52_002727 [Chlamydomonas sp. UWO 241]|nr:hypothetical protein FOA52_002727 [Chlamydomonas sp. UWO 241]